MTTLVLATCRVPGCGGPASGVCLNGLEFDECPDIVQPEEVTALPRAPEAVEVIRTGTGLTFSVDDADLFLRANGGVVIAAVAGPDAGKTTLAATVYELAHRGKLEGIGFAGSDTIGGFEERCFLSRIASGEQVADTARTPTSAEVAFLHLRLALSDGRRADLLISDRSGEHFEDALDRPERFGDFVELGRAEILLLLLDAERLANFHHVEIARMRKLILGLSHAGVLENRKVHLVLTKSDRIIGEILQTLVGRRAADILAELGRRAPTADVMLHQTACRPIAGSSTVGQGVQSLIEALLPDTPNRAFTTRVFSPPQEGGTALDRLLFQVRRD